jgi:hypothetical protein
VGLPDHDGAKRLLIIMVVSARRFGKTFRQDVSTRRFDKTFRQDVSTRQGVIALRLLLRLASGFRSTQPDFFRY